MLVGYNAERSEQVVKTIRVRYIGAIMNPDNLAAQQLVEKLITAFPDDAAWIDERMQSQGFEPREAPYIWIEHFSQRTTDALKVGNTTQAVSHLNLISRLLFTADVPTERCIDVAYVESLMWDMNDEIKKQGWLLIPQNLRILYAKIWGDKPFMDARQ
jgi:hypothetical protein